MGVQLSNRRHHWPWHLPVSRSDSALSDGGRWSVHHLIMASRQLGQVVSSPFYRPEKVD